jgi:hypothetical protein
MSKCNCSSQKPLLTAGIWNRVLWFRSLDLRPPSRFILEGVTETFRYSSETPTYYQNDLTMRNTADVKGGKSFNVWLQSILLIL